MNASKIVETSNQKQRTPGPCRHCTAPHGEVQEYGVGPGNPTVWWCVTCTACGFTAEAALSSDRAVANWNCNSHTLMLETLYEALNYFEAREDLNYEGTGPNAAMSLANEIRAAIRLAEQSA